MTVKLFRKIAKTNRLQIIAIISLTVLPLITTVFLARYYDNQNKLLLDRMTELLIGSEPELNTELPYQKLGKFILTFYCPCEKCVGKKKVIRTATGTTPKANRTIAVDPKVIPLGSIIYIEGYGYFIAEDTGGKVQQNRIDVFVSTHTEALKKGKKTANVYLLK